MSVAPCVAPTFEFESALWREGVTAVAGIDEVGRGPLAGPLVAAAVILRPGCDAHWLSEVRDSKCLPPARRERLAAVIRRDALAAGVGAVPAGVVDGIGLTAATRRAMQLAVAYLAVSPRHLLIDALRLPDEPLPQTPIVHGDARSLSIACASIVAKVARDRMLVRLDGRFPGYDLAQNKGYGTAAHLAALIRLGPCPIHRRTFAPVRAVLDMEAADG